MLEKTENIIKGIAAAPGISIAEAYRYTKEIQSINRDPVDNVEEAKQNLQEALNKSKKELKKVFSLANDKLGANRAAIFEAQIMILDDPVLLENIFNRIENEKINPEGVVHDEISKYQEIMSASDESYMKERSQDIEDIKFRIIKNLKKKKWKSRISSNVIVVTDNITPADTILFSRENVKGYVTDFGGLTSHAAILARSLSIPAVLGLVDATQKIEHGDILIVDGYHGQVIINPTQEHIEYYQKKIEEIQEHDKELALLKDEPAITLDGREIKIMGNLDLSEELAMMMANGSKGLGLVRTEQIFEEFEDFPDEEEQLKVYNELAERIYPDQVIIRTLDIGGDKVLPVDLKEANPFLGWRGVRLSLDNPKLFKTQLRAILRSSTHKNVKIMIPMITSIFEVRQSKKYLEECKVELEAEGYKFDRDIDFGIMIEVPSAAVMANQFAEEVDFISIGTNDLIQYLLAVDRGNDIVTDLYQEFHPAVIRTLKHILKSCEEVNTPVSMCGEMAADILAIPLLVGLGLDSISVSASVIPTIKKIIRSIEYSEVKELAEECLQYRTEIEINDRVKRFFASRLVEFVDEWL